MEQLWRGLRDLAREKLTQRNYQQTTLSQRLGTTGVEASELVAADLASLASGWIPGVEIFPRRIFTQRHRGIFGEFARENDGALAAIGLWPSQWATATMWAGTAKGFHIHPPFIPEDTDPEAWFRRLFIEEPQNTALRPYKREQWDAMFFAQGCVEMLLVDERAGLDRRVMRFIIDGDNHRGSNNVGVVIPAGVAHALRVESSENVIMVYGTSTSFEPRFEGRIESGIETLELPAEWQAYMLEGH